MAGVWPISLSFSAQQEGNIVLKVSHCELLVDTFICPCIGPSVECSIHRYMHIVNSNFINENDISVFAWNSSTILIHVKHCVGLNIRVRFGRTLGGDMTQSKHLARVLWIQANFRLHVTVSSLLTVWRYVDATDTCSPQYRKQDPFECMLFRGNIIY